MGLKEEIDKLIEKESQSIEARTDAQTAGMKEAEKIAVPLIKAAQEIKEGYSDYIKVQIFNFDVNIFLGEGFEDIKINAGVFLGKDSKPDGFVIIEDNSEGSHGDRIRMDNVSEVIEYISKEVAEYIGGIKGWDNYGKKRLKEFKK